MLLAGHSGWLPCKYLTLLVRIARGARHRLEMHAIAVTLKALYAPIYRAVPPLVEVERSNS